LVLSKSVNPNRHPKPKVTSSMLLKQNMPPGKPQRRTGKRPSFFLTMKKACLAMRQRFFQPQAAQWPRDSVIVLPDTNPQACLRDLLLNTSQPLPIIFPPPEKPMWRQETIFPGRPVRSDSDRKEWPDLRQQWSESDDTMRFEGYWPYLGALPAVQYSINPPYFKHYSL